MHKTATTAGAAIAQEAAMVIGVIIAVNVAIKLGSKALNMTTAKLSKKEKPA